jgi:hypothetical protein
MTSKKGNGKYNSSYKGNGIVPPTLATVRLWPGWGNPVLGAWRGR